MHNIQFSSFVYPIFIHLLLQTNFVWLRAKHVVQSQDQLLLVQSVWRHGDRSPTRTYLLDPHQADAWPQGWGQLTTRGMTQQVELGGRLRKRYVEQLKLFGNPYRRDELHVHSTDMDRTLMSAISNLIGFYGPSTRQGIDYPNNTAWPGNFLPIPIHTVEAQTDHAANPNAYCPRELAIARAFNLTPEYAELMRRKSWFFERLSNLTGERIVDPFRYEKDSFPLGKLWDVLRVEKIYGKKWPDWLTPALWDEINHLIELNDDWMAGLGLVPYRGLNFSLELPKMRGGPLLWSFIDRMREKVHCIDEALNASSPSSAIPKACQTMSRLKYYAYSAHESTIAALFSTFHFDKTNFDADGWPGYSACVTVELWAKGSANLTAVDPHDAYNVKVLYWKPNTTEAKEITPWIIGCEEGCTLRQFAERSQPYRAKPSIVEYCANENIFAEQAELRGSESNSAWSDNATSFVLSIILLFSTPIMFLHFNSR